MGEAIATVLPYAVGAAVSPLLLTVEVLILAGAFKPRSRAWVYAAGALVVAILITTAIAFIFRQVAPGTSGPSPLERGVEVTAGIVLAIMAIRSFLPVHVEGEGKPSRLHEWMQHGRTGTFFIVGMIMMATNGSSIVIMIPGIHAVEALRPGFAEGTVALVILIAFVMLPAVVPVGLATAFGSRSDAFLHALNAFVTKHLRTITGVLCTVIALYLFHGAFS